MSATGLDEFDTTIQKTNRWLREVMEIGGWQDRHTAYVELRGMGGPVQVVRPGWPGPNA